MMMYAQLIKLPILITAIVFQCGGPRMPNDAQQSNKTLVVQGILDSSGNELIKIDKPALYKRNLSHPTPNLRTGRYMVFIQYQQTDSAKTYFDAFVGGDREDRMQHGFFEVQVPVKDRQILLVKIMEVATGKVLATFRQNDIMLK